jgi:Phosphotransferase enzyme family
MPVVRRFITFPGSGDPHLIVPVDRPRVAAYAIDTWTAPESALRRLRNRVARTAIAARAFPDLSRSVTVGSRGGGPPFVVAAANPLGVPGDVDWFLTLGLGDALTRAVYHLFAAGDAHPRWIIKFSRVGGYTAPFERDERGLVLAAASPAAALHAPRFMGRFEVSGLPASIEEAAVGQRLTMLLQRPGQRAGKLRAIDAVASWLVDLSRESAVPPPELIHERRRLEQEVLPQWGDAVPPDLVTRVSTIPGVLAHNDLGCWNLVVGPGGFKAVDWESATRPGLPLWDLVYFLVDALVHLDRAWAPGDREAHAARLLLGQTPSSQILFRWLRAAIGALEIPPAAVGPVVTLAWLHHGLSRVSRTANAQALAPGATGTQTFGEWMVRVWLATPGLGPDWSCWVDG